MVQEKEARDYFDLELLRDELDEQLVLSSKCLESFDKEIMENSGKGEMIEKTMLDCSQIMQGARVKEAMKNDSEYLCKNAIFTNKQQPAQQQQQQRQQMQRPVFQQQAQQRNTNYVQPPIQKKATKENCAKCKNELIQQTCQKAGANHGRDFLRCPQCGKFVRW